MLLPDVQCVADPVARPADALVKEHEPPQPATQAPLVNRQAEAAGASTPTSPPSVYSSARSSPRQQHRASVDECVSEAASEPRKEASVVPVAPGTDLLASAMGLMGSQADGGQGPGGAGMGRQRSMLPSSSAKLAHVMLRVQETPQKARSPSSAAMSVLAMTVNPACCWHPKCKRRYRHLAATLLKAVLTGISSAAPAIALCAARQAALQRSTSRYKVLKCTLTMASVLCRPRTRPAPAQRRSSGCARPSGGSRSLPPRQRGGGPLPSRPSPSPRRPCCPRCP